MTGLPHGREQSQNTPQSTASAVLRPTWKVTTYTFILQIYILLFLTCSAVSSLRVEFLPYFVYTW